MRLWLEGNDAWHWLPRRLKMARYRSGQVVKRSA